MNCKHLVVLIPILCPILSLATGGDPHCAVSNMVLIEGGTFDMGDIFGERTPLAAAVHKVALSDFSLNRFEVTVEEFAAFVEDTAYVTSAERGENCAAREGTGPPPQSQEEYDALLASCGSLILDPSVGRQSWGMATNWRNPQFEQSAKDPVVCVSWRDAISYCNWLSKREGLPIAYDVASGNLLDATGQPTADVTKVRGYRLPTEAEWEFAARERGKKVRFGNGKDTARPAEMNFNAADRKFPYSEKGQLRGGTVPVGSFKPNSLGLHDMSGNVWEWCSDFVGKYGKQPQTNPYQQKGVMGPRRAARGGPWAGDASFARVYMRLGWVADDRCNNIGFRMARSE
ncbi:MAG: formylglycine-generating enzyme family protein [Phycisphaerales bacterium]|nr:MAG: formylglycine-generating enzyme family protein [Phycisphaerales bacterium]